MIFRPHLPYFFKTSPYLAAAQVRAFTVVSVCVWGGGGQKRGRYQSLKAFKTDLNSLRKAILKHTPSLNSKIW